MNDATRQAPVSPEIYTNGATPHEDIPFGGDEQEPISYNDLLIEATSETSEGDHDSVHEWAIENIDRIAQLADTDQEKFQMKLRNLGAQSSWLKNNYRTLLNKRVKALEEDREEKTATAEARQITEAYIENHDINSESLQAVLDQVRGAEADDNGSAKSFISLFGRNHAYVEGYGWMWFNGTHWEDDESNASIVERVIATLSARRLAIAQTEFEDLSIQKKMFSSVKADASRIRGVLFVLESKLHRSAKSLNQDRNLLNVKNGIIDLRTAEFLTDDEGNPVDRRDYMFTYCIDAEYHEKSGGQNDPNLNDWFNVLDHITGGDTELNNYLQTAIGYTLTGENREECLFYIYGPARSGKGTMLNTIREILGKPLSIGTAVSTFRETNSDAQNFRIAPLHKARMVVASESGSKMKLDSTMLKQITGGDEVQAAFKNKNPFAFVPQWKLWIMSNVKPNAPVDDEAFWTSRLKLINVNGKSLVGEEDKDLKDRLMTPEARNSILSWAIQGAFQYYLLGLEEPESVTLSTKEARDEIDTVKLWLDECCVIEEGAKASLDELFQNYTTFMEIGEKQRFSKSRRSFGRSLSDRGFESGKIYYAKTQKSNLRVYHGLRLDSGAFQ